MRKTVRLGAVLIDVLIVMTIATMATWLLGAQDVWESFAFSGLVEVGVGLVLNLLGSQIGISPGQWLMLPMSAALSVSKRAWLNFGLGLLTILDGTKSLVRWKQSGEVMPIMGVVPEGAALVATSIGLGAALLFAGAGLLRLERMGKLSAIVVNVFLLVSLFMSWSVLPSAIEKMVVARMAAQGLPLDASRVEFMQQVFPLFSVAVLLAMLTASFFVYVREEGQKRALI